MAALPITLKTDAAWPVATLSDGITARDLFAVGAIVGLLAQKNRVNFTPTSIALEAWAIADEAWTQR